jgi:hypothetical protein
MKADELKKIAPNRSVFDQLADRIRDNGVANTLYGPVAAGISFPRVHGIAIVRKNRREARIFPHTTAN